MYCKHLHSRQDTLDPKLAPPKVSRGDFGIRVEFFRPESPPKIKHTFYIQFMSSTNTPDQTLETETESKKIELFRAWLGGCK
jgi:hypothetical protein